MYNNEAIDEFENGMIVQLQSLFLHKPVTIYMDAINVSLQAEGFVRTFVGFCESITPYGITLRHIQENGKDKRSFHFLDKINTIEELDEADFSNPDEDINTNEELFQ